MSTGINASVAGVVGLSNTRESRLTATGAGPQASSFNQATRPLEENTDVGDRDAQEQYLRGESNEQSKQRDNSQPSQEQASSLLQLPAEDDQSQILDMLG